jgi:hypothetical protein
MKELLGHAAPTKGSAQELQPLIPETSTLEIIHHNHLQQQL